MIHKTFYAAYEWPMEQYPTNTGTYYIYIQFKEKHKVGCEGGLKVSLAGVFTKIGTFGNKYAGVLRSVLLLFNPKLGAPST